ncbi:MAG: NAD(P)-dependent alcohol dehydrogenase [Anaerolineales bacterium]|nr:NAD(P)-dependent alcohol dehydrogenase [Chloroflexota bacterium]MBL6982041.1 NAD(P)-dependent alcohol dehydrogenase [Anaerolineales bacterium]
MKAIVYEKYGPPEVLYFDEIAKPIVKDDEILIKVHAASVTPLDWHMLTGTPYIARLMAGLIKPKRKVLGTDVAGVVESVGVNVKQFQPGDEVFGLSFYNGAFAEYLCVPESQLQLVHKPSNISFEAAAVTPYAGYTALLCLRDLGCLQSGQKVLINGASGGTGTFAVQIAKSFGAEVTGVCSTRNLERVRSIGADHVIDYTKEDFSQNTGAYDLIFDVVRKRTFSECKDALKPQGIYVTTEFSPALMIQSQWASIAGGKKLIPLPMKRPSQQDFLDLKELLETGKITPVIDRRYPLNEVPDALRYIGKGHARGKLVITI